MSALGNLRDRSVRRLGQRVRVRRPDERDVGIARAPLLVCASMIVHSIAIARMLPIARALAAGALLAAAAHASGRIAVAEIEVAGPFDGATLEVQGRGFTRIDGHLLAGESQLVRVPVPTRDTTRGEHTPRELPRIHLDPGAIESGRVRVVRWLDGASRDLDLLPPGLRARPRPPIERSGSSASAAALAWLAASACIGLSLRRRARIAIAFGCVSAAIAFSIGPRGEPSTPRRVIVEEGVAESSAWLEVEAARSELAIAGALESVHVESAPESAEIECRVDLASPHVWRLTARGVLYRLTPHDAGEHVWSRAANGWTDLDETWLREEGRWSARGAWRLGDPLPPERTGVPPPGWLASGLPQGIPILLGRARSRDADVATFVRVSGL